MKINRLILPSAPGVVCARSPCDTWSCDYRPGASLLVQDWFVNASEEVKATVVTRLSGLH